MVCALRGWGVHSWKLLPELVNYINNKAWASLHNACQTKWITTTGLSATKRFFNGFSRRFKRFRIPKHWLVEVRISVVFLRPCESRALVALCQRLSARFSITSDSYIVIRNGKASCLYTSVISVSIEESSNPAEHGKTGVRHGRRGRRSPGDGTRPAGR